MASVFAFRKLAQFELQDNQLSQRAVIYFVLFPTSFFLFAPYTESLFTFGSILCLLALREKNWVAAGIWGMLSAASRLTGALIFVPVFWTAWQSWKENSNWWVWLAPLLVLLTSLASG